jgi:hypothetical protein
MVYSGMLRRVALVTSVLTRTTRRNIPEDTILHSHRRENLESYVHIHVWEIYNLVNVNTEFCRLADKY